MQTPIFRESDLPIKQLEDIGLAEKGRILLDQDNLKALLSGNRTEMVHLKNLRFEGAQIEALRAKISVGLNATGELVVLQHPVYKQAVRPELLTQMEARELESGVLANLLKEVKAVDGTVKEVLFEFDPQTREFITTDTSKIVAPDFVNSQELTASQKQDYRKGKEVELSDGTVFKYAAADAANVRANRIALLASILIDGGISYMLIQGIKSLAGANQAENSAYIFSEGYHKAMDEYTLDLGKVKEQRVNEGFEADQEVSRKRGVSR